MKKILAFGSTALCGLLMAPVAFAAADADITAAASSTATTIKENVMESITTVLPIVLIAGVTILVVNLVWRFSKRFVSGR